LRVFKLDPSINMHLLRKLAETALQFTVCVCLLPFAGTAIAAESQNVVLVTIDGLRWQEVFGGADERLISDDGGVKDVPAAKQRFLRENRKANRETLMPFFWSVIAAQGVVYGDPEHRSTAVLSNTLHFSYPGYSELLTGFFDPRIDSNAKKYNENITVLEWFNQKPEFNGRVAAFCSWDVFPYIINDRRSGVVVNAGWQPTATLLDPNDEAVAAARQQLVQLDQLAEQVPRVWPGVRFDYFTFKAAETYFKAMRPRVLYLSLGEVDDWAHEGRYDLYLDSAQRSDRSIGELWETIQSIPQYKDRTTLIVTTDHGRGEGRNEWKSHSSSIPGCEAIWIAMIGPGIDPHQAIDSSVTQSQVASTVAACLGYDFQRDFPQAAAPLPAVSIREKSAR
jgi:hypothetical protein